MGAFQRFFTLNADKLHMFLPKTDTIIPWTALCLGLWIPNIYYWGLNQYITQRTLGSASLAEGQKGMVFAAALKLLIPFIIVFPGIIAFNLFDKDMADSAVADYVVAHEAGVKKYLGFTVLAPSEAWQAKNADKMPIVTAYNAEVTAKAAAAQKSTTVAYKSDTALGLLIAKLCMGKKGLFGFIIAALLGAIVSSLAAVLNAASTIFAIDIYSEYINKQASQSSSLRSVASAWVSSWSSVAWWRRCWTIRSSAASSPTSKSSKAMSRLAFWRSLFSACSTGQQAVRPV